MNASKVDKVNLHEAVRGPVSGGVIVLMRGKVVGYFLEVVAVIFFLAAATYYGDYGQDKLVEALLTAFVGFVLLVLGVREARVDHSQGK